MERYKDPEKVERLMKSRQDAGLWYPDDDFSEEDNTDFCTMN